MTRRQILCFVPVMLATFILSGIILALSPVWVAFLMLKPDYLKPFSDMATKKVMQQGIKTMMKSGSSMRM